MHKFVSHIDPSNKALQFIDDRLADDNYRGNWSSQHNRYTMEDTVDIMRLMYEHVKMKLMLIRTTDISKRPSNTEEEKTFAEFCNKAKEKVGIGTQDAMRKNLFPDFHRMGFIERYDNNKVRIDPLSTKSRKKYVSSFLRG